MSTIRRQVHIIQSEILIISPALVLLLICSIICYKPLLHTVVRLSFQGSEVGPPYGKTHQCLHELWVQEDLTQPIFPTRRYCPVKAGSVRKCRTIR